MTHEDLLDEHLDLALRLEQGFTTQFGRRCFYRAARQLAAKMGMSFEAMLDDLTERANAIAELNAESND
jgi:hypothetical protein